MLTPRAAVVGAGAPAAATDYSRKLIESDGIKFLFGIGDRHRFTRCCIVRASSFESQPCDLHRTCADHMSPLHGVVSRVGCKYQALLGIVRRAHDRVLAAR